jgi:hypothetical protein
MSAAINGPTFAPDRGKVIMQLTWGKDSKSLIFVGRDRQENRQLFRVAVTDHKITALTPPTQDIVDYGAAGDSIAYLAGADVSSERLWSSNDPDAPDILVGAGHPLIAMLYPNYGKTNRAMPTEFEVWRVLGTNAEPVIVAISHKAMLYPQPTLRRGRTPSIDPARGPASRLTEAMENMSWEKKLRAMETGAGAMYRTNGH